MEKEVYATKIKSIQRCIAAIRLNDVATVNKFLNEYNNATRVEKINFILQQACLLGADSVIQSLLASLQHLDASTVVTLHEGLYEAAFNGNTSVIKVLLADGRIDPTAATNSAIEVACANSHFDIIKLLLADHRINRLQVVQHCLDDQILIDFILKEGYTTAAEVASYQHLQRKGFF